MIPGHKSPRKRTYEWDDPLAFSADIATRSGRELLLAMLQDTIPQPPFSATMGLELIEVGDGRIAFTLEPGEWHYNQTGGVHGGVHTTMLDSALGCAVHSRLPAGIGYTTLEVSVRYLRQVRTDTGLL